MFNISHHMKTSFAKLKAIDEGKNDLNNFPIN